MSFPALLSFIPSSRYIYGYLLSKKIQLARLPFPIKLISLHLQCWSAEFSFLAMHSIRSDLQRLDKHSVEFFNFPLPLNRPLKILSFENISENNTVKIILFFLQYVSLKLDHGVKRGDFGRFRALVSLHCDKVEVPDINKKYVKSRNLSIVSIKFILNGLFNFLLPFQKKVSVSFDSQYKFYLSILYILNIKLNKSWTIF